MSRLVRTRSHTVAEVAQRLQNVVQVALLLFFFVLRVLLLLFFVLRVKGSRPLPSLAIHGGGRARGLGCTRENGARRKP